MIQKEVGERITALPRPAGQGKMNLLAISVQAYGKPKIIAKVSKKHFSPQPKVDSVIIEISNISRAFFLSVLAGKNAERRFFRLVKMGFSAKRKLLTNNLARIALKSALPKFLAKCQIPEKARAENLSLANWACLCKNLKQNLSTKEKSRKNLNKVI